MVLETSIYPEMRLAIMGVRNGVALLIVTMVLGVLMDSIDASIVNVALPSIASDFATDTSVVSWVTIAYFLMMAGFLLPFGRVADAGHIRRVFMLGFVVFTGFSLLCAVAPTLEVLIIARIAQGVGAAAIAAVAPMICVKLLPREHLGRSLGIMALASSTGFALGPALGGVLVEFLSWHWIFLINIPIGVVALLIGHVSLPGEDRSKIAVDVKGSALLFLAVTFAVLAFERLSYPGEILICVVSAVLAVVFVAGFAYESLRSDHPLFDVRLFRIRNLDLALLSYTILNLVYMGVLYVLPFYMDLELGLGSMVSGVVLLIPSVFVLLMSIPVGNYTDMHGRRSCAIAASVFTLAYSVVLFIMDPEMGMLPLILASVLMGVVWGFSGTASSGRVVDNTPDESKAIGSSMMSFMNYMGGTVGTALFASLLTSGSDSGGVPIEELSPGAFMDGMEYSMLWAVALSVVMLVMSVAVNDRRKRDASGA